MRKPYLNLIRIIPKLSRNHTPIRRRAQNPQGKRHKHARGRASRIRIWRRPNPPLHPGIPGALVHVVAPDDCVFVLL